ncbi:hypothetical protein Tco_0961611, partial [Tanacetum coccineum]
LKSLNPCGNPVPIGDGDEDVKRFSDVDGGGDEDVKRFSDVDEGGDEDRE